MPGISNVPPTRSVYRLRHAPRGLFNTFETAEGRSQIVVKYPFLWLMVAASTPLQIRRAPGVGFPALCQRPRRHPLGDPRSDLRSGVPQPIAPTIAAFHDGWPCARQSLDRGSRSAWMWRPALPPDCQCSFDRPYRRRMDCIPECGLPIPPTLSGDASRGRTISARWQT